MTATRVAAVDCGTNSVRLLVADLPGEAAGLPTADASAGRTAGGAGPEVAAEPLAELVRRMEIVRLGEGVDRTGRLSPEAITRTQVALVDYASEITRLGAKRVRMVATSASRDASNAAEFVAMVRQTLGVEPEVITGEEEAQLSYAGAVRGLPAGARPPYLVVDIGGGSTEFVLGSDRGRYAAAVSVDIGCVRMTERHLPSDPPSTAQIAAATADITTAVDRALATLGQPRPGTLIGLAGSVTTVAAIAADLPGYDPARIHHQRISFPKVAQVTSDLLAMPRQQRAALPVMHPGRADVIGAGALILRVAMARASVAEVLVSEHDILDGIAWSLA